MKIRDLINRPGAWLDSEHDDGIVVSSRVRIARNISGEMFPSRMSEEALVDVWHRLSSELSEVQPLKDASVFDMGELDTVEKHILRERHLISIEHSERGKGSGLVLSEDEQVSIMVNEEDHIRIQSMRPGLDLERVWKAVDAIELALDERVKYAYSPRFGYLTSCPSNVGTGLRASVMLHLPGLGLLNEIDGVVRGLTKIGLAVRGLLGEGTEASGNMFQISNQSTLGESEQTIIRRLGDIVEEIADHEKNARIRLQEQRSPRIRDYVGRSYGILLNARLLSSREMLDLLSGLRLGLVMGLIDGIALSSVYELMLLTQPGHMQTIYDKDLSPEDRDEMRARTVRNKLNTVALVDDR